MNCMEVSRYVVHRWQGQHASTAYEILPDGGRWLAIPSGVVAGRGVGGGDSIWGVGCRPPAGTIYTHAMSPTSI